MASKEPAPLNFVHQNAILCETIKKEQKHQKLHKDYRVNPFKKSKGNVSLFFGFVNHVISAFDKSFRSNHLSLKIMFILCFISLLKLSILKIVISLSDLIIAVMVLFSVNVLASKPNSNVEDDTQEDGMHHIHHCIIYHCTMTTCTLDTIYS